METVHRNNFLTISLEECGKYYLNVQENAEEHYKCSKILSIAGYYPNAIAHLILGTEELLKALALFLESKGFGLRQVEGYKKLFYNHKARHGVIKDFFSAVMALKSVIAAFEEASPDKSKFDNIMEGVTKVAIASTKAYINYHWWKGAEELKQNCFYVDYENQLITPDGITKQNYSTSLSFVESIRDDVRFILVFLNKIDKKQLESIQEDFRTAGLHDLLQETIERSKER